MKKVLIIAIIISAWVSSCKKVDKPAFDKSADERLTETLAAYQTQLSGAANGWKGFLTTDSGRGTTYSFYFKFNDANRVTMLSDFDSASAVTPKESSYRLKALQQPSLLFDTYSYIHVLADPDETVNGGTRGAGLVSDFEFYFDSSSADTIKLVGRIFASKMMLVKATQAEETAYNGGGLAAGLNINKIVTYFKRLTIGSDVYDVRINTITRQFVFGWFDANGSYQTFTTGFYFAAGEILFTNPVVNGSQLITGFSNITWSQATQKINLTVNNSSATMTGIVVPLKVDVGAPRRWWQYAIDNGNNPWTSLNGFHVNGKEDAFGIKSLVSGDFRYAYLLYWPTPGPPINSTTNDFFGPIFTDVTGNAQTIIYGSAADIPTFTNDGRVLFSELGTYGQYPTSGPAALTADQLYIPNGYYLVQTSAVTYDMVSAADGKAWISWEF
ncbi:MAG: DUF4302 domain-containing protein [Ginsengibacter sp.]